MNREVTQALFELLPIDGTCMTVPAIAKASGFDRKEVAKSCGKLVYRQLAIRAETGCYKLSEAGIAARLAGAKIKSGPIGRHTGVAKRSQDTLSKRVWRALRSSGKATVPELLVLASRGDETPDALRERREADVARHFLNGLIAAGYVAKMGARAPGSAAESNGFIKYFLLKNTGPEMPLIRKSRGLLFDPNTKENIPLDYARARKAVSRRKEAVRS